MEIGTSSTVADDTGPVVVDTVEIPGLPG